jgi:hypothetical protein
MAGAANAAPAMPTRMMPLRAALRKFFAIVSSRVPQQNVACLMKAPTPMNME